MNSDQGRIARRMGAACMAWACASEAKTLETSLADAWKGASQVRYATPSPQDLASARSLFERLLRGERDTSVQQQARALGWQLHLITDDRLAWVVLQEIPAQRAGRGLYAFSGRGRHAIEAPHVPSDRLTGEIALKIAREALPRAVAWNTVHRRQADFAHLADSYMVEFSRAFATVHPSDAVIQLHGYDAQRRATQPASDSGAIVSAGHAASTARVRELGGCLRRSVEPATRVYGLDATELGGTTNTIGRALRARGHEGFIHLEMGVPLRESLLADASKRRAFVDCLQVPQP